MCDSELNSPVIRVHVLWLSNPQLFIIFTTVNWRCWYWLTACTCGQFITMELAGNLPCWNLYEVHDIFLLHTLCVIPCSFFEQMFPLTVMELAGNPRCRKFVWSAWQFLTSYLMCDTLFFLWTNVSLNSNFARKAAFPNAGVIGRFKSDPPHGPHSCNSLS